MTTTNSTTKGFTTIAIIAIIWNIFGVVSYLMHAYMTPETIATLPEYQQDFMNNTPTWRMAVFAIATFSGLIASILLIMKKKLATSLFIVSFITIIVGDIYDFFIANYYKNGQTSDLAIPILVFLIGIFLVWYSIKMKSKGILS